MISADLPSLLQSFFTERLLRQRQASPHTIAGYRDSFRLLLQFAKERLGKAPSKIRVEDLDAPFLGLFLGHLEDVRKNSTRTRNARLAAIHFFLPIRGFRGTRLRAALSTDPGHAEQTARTTADRVP